MSRWRSQFRFSRKIILLTHTALRTNTTAMRTETSTEQTVQMKVGASSLNEIVWSRPHLDRYMYVFPPKYTLHLNLLSAWDEIFTVQQFQIYYCLHSSRKVFFHMKTIQYNHSAVICSVPKCCIIELLIIGPSWVAHGVESFPTIYRKRIAQRYGSLPLRCGTEPRRIYN